MSTHQLRRPASTMILGLLLQALPAQTRTGGQDPALTLIHQIRDAEARVSLARIEGTFTVHTFDRTTKEMTFYGRDFFEVLFEAAPGTRSRLERNTPEVLPEGARATNDLPRYRATYDGRIGTFLQENTGRGEEERIYVTLTAEAPSEIKDWSWTASMWRLSIFGCSAGDGHPYSRILADGLKRERAPVQVEAGELDGLPTIVASADDGTSRRVVHHDPAHGHAIVGMRLEKAGRLRVLYRVDDLREVAPGVFFPWIAERRSWNADGSPSEVGRFEARSILVNDDAAEGPGFAIEIPHGVSVSDVVSDVTVTSGYDAASLERALFEEARRLKVLDSPASDPAVIVLPPAEGPPAVDPAAAASVNLKRLGGLLLLVTSAIGALVVFARRRISRPAVAMGAVLVALSLALPAKAQDQPLGLAELDGFRAHNCGLNACGLVLGYFERGFSAETSARELDIGARWDRPASLLNMLRLLTRSGLAVRALKSPSIENAVAELHPGTVVILHLHGGIFRVGHFFVLVRQHQDLVLVADPGHGVAWCPISKLVSKYEPFMSGHFLTVTDPGHMPPVEKPVYRPGDGDLETPVIVTHQEKGELRYEIEVENPHDRPIRLLSSSGSCSCFAGARLEGELPGIEGGSRGTLVVEFDKSKLQLGRSDQQVRILFGSDERQWESTIHLKLLVSEGTTPDMISYLPERLDLEASRTHPGSCSERVTFLLPAVATVSSVTTSSDAVRVRLANVGAASWERTRTPRQTLVYEVTVDMARAADSENWFELALGDCELSTIRIPIRAVLRAD